MLKRNAKSISSKITISKDGVTCSDRCTIEFPKWYQDKGLATIEKEVTLYGIFAIIVGDEYSVSFMPTLCSSKPISISEIEREDGETYTQLHFAKGDKILEGNSLVKQGRLAVALMENFYMAAKMPWFIEYEDCVRILDNAPIYSGTGMGSAPVASELLSSFIARSSKDKKVYYRQVNATGEIAWVDLLNPYYSIRNNVNKIAGGYLSDNLVSAIVEDSKSSTKLERLARS